MNKILQEAADEIANTFALNNGWCDDKRVSVSKILKTMEAKILQTTNSDYAAALRVFDEWCKKEPPIDDVLGKFWKWVRLNSKKDRHCA